MKALNTCQETYPCIIHTKFFIQFHGIHRPWNLLEVRAVCPGTPGFCLFPAVSHLLLHNNHSKTWQLKQISDGFCGTGIWEGLSWVALIQDPSWAGSQDTSRGDSHLTAGSWIPPEPVIWDPEQGGILCAFYNLLSESTLGYTHFVFLIFFNGIWSLCSSASLFLFMLFIYLLWLSWVITGERGLSLLAASRGYSSLTVCGFLGEVASLVKPRP